MDRTAGLLIGNAVRVYLFSLLKGRCRPCLQSVMAGTLCPILASLQSSNLALAT